MARTLAALELLLADIFWGFGFVATAWVLKVLDPHTLTWLRFAIAGIVGLAGCALFRRLRGSINATQLKLALFPGLWLSLTITLQTWGIQFTTPTKAGFITTLYVLMVPFLDTWWLKRKLSNWHFAYVFVALLGTVLICDLHSLDPNWGDFLIFLSAIAASLQIFWFGLIQKEIRSPMVFNSLQCLWSIPIPLVFSLFSARYFLPSELNLHMHFGFLSLVFGSTLFAFALQVKAQKKLSPSVASLLFLLESPIAAVFSAVLMNERLALHQWIGGVLIMFAAAACVLELGRKGNKTN